MCDECGGSYRLVNKGSHQESNKHRAALTCRAQTAMIAPPKRVTMSSTSAASARGNNSGRAVASAAQIHCRVCGVAYRSVNQQSHDGSKKHREALQRLRQSVPAAAASAPKPAAGKPAISKSPGGAAPHAPKSAKDSKRRQVVKRVTIKLLTSTPPINGITGEWVHWNDFHGEKSFGAFHCHECRHAWLSAHSWKGLWQRCQRCEEEVRPLLFWRNVERKSRDEDEDEDANKPNNKPHDMARCQKCQLLRRGCWER